MYCEAPRWARQRNRAGHTWNPAPNPDSRAEVQAPGSRAQDAAPRSLAAGLEIAGQGGSGIEACTADAERAERFGPWVRQRASPVRRPNAAQARSHAGRAPRPRRRIEAQSPQPMPRGSCLPNCLSRFSSLPAYAPACSEQTTPRCCCCRWLKAPPSDPEVERCCPASASRGPRRPVAPAAPSGPNR